MTRSPRRLVTTSVYSMKAATVSGPAAISAASLEVIVLLLQSKCPLLKTGICSFFFGTGEEADTLGSGSIAGGGDGVPHLGGGILLVLKEVQRMATKTGPSRRLLVDVLAAISETRVERT